MNACLLRPKARGSVTIRSADPYELPLINPNFLGHGDDIKHQLKGLRTSREILSSPPLSNVIDQEIYPGPRILSDEELTIHAKRTVKSNWHPVGTCRMGKEKDIMAVVSPKLEVHGLEGLRIFDISVMPKLVSANTTAPTMAIADRGVTLMME